MKTISIPQKFVNNALINRNQYHEMYKLSVAEPYEFWNEQSKLLHWHKPWSKLNDIDFSKGHIQWFADGELNVSYNCIDRHLPENASKTAIIWESDSGDEVKHISYQQLHDEVCRLANALRELGIQKGDSVTIYMPMIPEAAYAMLACARIGAIHSVVFAGFSPESLKSRMLDSNSKLLITADEAVRGGKKTPLKQFADKALEGDIQNIKTLVYRRTLAPINWVEGRDNWYHELVSRQSPNYTAEAMNAESPLFILYTSGSTGKPKGLMHTSGGYLLYATITFKYVFDYKPGEIYWCTADVGWVTGHSYLVYGPLSCGATTLMFEGVPTYPDASRIWQVVDKHRVNILYTAPTLIRALEKEGDSYVKSTSRISLRLLGTVGEPINPEAWRWFYEVCGDSRCPIVDTWWQTETGGHLIAPIPGAIEAKPGSATLPFFGIQPAILSPDGQKLEGAAEGVLAIGGSWPAQARSIWGDHPRFIETYFSQYPGYYFTGDGARRDEDGYYWITGRVDDVLNVSGHRMGTAEIESALVLDPAVSEAAVVGFPHEVKGQGIFAFVILKDGHTESDDLHKRLIDQVKSEIGAIAKPDRIIIASNLPKTRSGKIMRRILRKIAEGDTTSLGDTSTLLNPEIVQELINKAM